MAACHEGLPSFLGRFSSLILRMHQAESKNKLERLQSVYSNVLLKGFKSLALVALIDNIHLADKMSLLTLQSISTGFQDCSCIVCTADGDPWSTLGHDMHVTVLKPVQGQIWSITLEPLTSPSARELAMSQIQCSSITDELLSIIMGNHMSCSGCNLAA